MGGFLQWSNGGVILLCHGDMLRCREIRNFLGVDLATLQSGSRPLRKLRVLQQQISAIKIDRRTSQWLNHTNLLDSLEIINTEHQLDSLPEPATKEAIFNRDYCSPRSCPVLPSTAGPDSYEEGQKTRGCEGFAGKLRYICNQSKLHVSATISGSWN